MNYEQFELVDAFLALKDIDDDVVDGMLREGKSFTVNRGSKDLEAAKSFLSEHADEQDVAIEVIDVNADSVDHIKNNQDYIGQAILSCNKCRSNRFIDIDLLKVSDGDDDVYNRDDECPHCHDAGAGYELIGQVGKMSTDAEDEEIDDTEATIDNDDKEADVTTFDNDVEEVDEVEEEEPADEDTDAESDESVDEVDFLSDEDEESDGMETDTSEDELDDLDLPALGDEIDPDDTEEDEDNDVKESLTESVELTGNAADAWMMNQVISHMNNEDAYYGSWLYTWPDGETKEMCAYDFSDQEDFDDLEEVYLRTYQRYHSDGLYAAPADVYEYARATDRKLGLAAIENLAEVKPFVRESLETDLVSDVVKSIINPEHIDTVVVTDGDRVIYEGSFEDLPRNIYGAECIHFDVADGYLSCNIDLEETVTNSPLGRFLDKFGDDETEKITLWDQATNDEVFTGTRDEAIKRYGNFEFSSVEAPSVLRLSVIGPEFVTQSDLEGEEISDLEQLANKVLTENNMSVYKSKNTKSDDFWVKHSIQHLEDIELIYERYVKPTGNKALIKEFKYLTGYSNPVEEAFEAGFNAANEANLRANARRDRQVRESRRASSANRKMINEAGPSRDLMIDAMQKVGKRYNFNKYTDAQIFRMYQKYVLDKPKRIDIEVDAEVDGQDKVEFPRCEACGIRLNDGGTCPVCDHGEPDMHEDLNQANIELPEFYDWIRNYKGGKLFDAYADEFSDEDEWIEINGVLEWLEGFDNNAYHDFLNRAHIEEDLDGDEGRDPASDVEIVEAVRSFKNRKDLAHAIQECKNNNRPYSVRRSTIEGYRYDLVEDADGEDVFQKLKDASNYEAFVKILNSDGKSKAFLDYLSQHYKLGDDAIQTVKKSGASEGKVKCSQLIPTQQNISLSKSLGMINKSGWAEKIINSPLEAFNDPTITYAGKYIIDGHHRWSKAYALNGGDCQIKVLNFPAISGVTWDDMLKATQLAIIANNPSASLVNDVGNDNMLTSSDDEIKKFVINNICDAVLEAMKAKGRGDDKEAVAETIVQNVAEMRSTSKPVSGAAPRSVMPQTDQAEGSLDDMKTAIIDLTEDTNLVPVHNGDIEIVDPISQATPVVYSPQQLSFMNELQRIGRDTANAIHQYYGIAADPAIIVADIIRDLKLISGDVSIEELTDSVADQATLAMFNSYNDFYNVVDAMISGVTGQEFHTTPDQKLRQAIRMLHGPNFTTDAINNAVGSTAFLRAAQNGNIPFIHQSDIPLLTEALSRCCEKCGKVTCECSEEYDEVEDDVLDLDMLPDDESSEELEIDTDLFDADLNQYFNEAYEDTVIYTTTSGHINENGVIVLEGLIQLDETISDISFKLDPGKAICESLTNKTKDISSILDATFNVTNNLSDETFEFRFKQ